MIEILLSTFNGEKYLEEQINSLFSQTRKDWTLTIRDDGSSDGTLGIIKHYQDLYPGKIKLLNDQKGRLGSSLSFGVLLQEASSEYIMFCDQDDHWVPDKIEITYQRMLDLSRNNPDTPLLVFTDLSTADETLEITEQSFMAHQKIYPEIIHDATKLLAMNVVPGCTMMINQFSKKFVLPIPASNIVHDQWIAVNIAHYGKIDFISIPTVLYRQHGKNAVGSNEVGARYFLKKISSPIKQFKIYRNLIIHLKFKVNIFAFVYHKLNFTIRRLYN